MLSENKQLSDIVSEWVTGWSAIGGFRIKLTTVEGYELDDVVLRLACVDSLSSEMQRHALTTEVQVYLQNRGRLKIIHGHVNLLSVKS